MFVRILFEFLFCLCKLNTLIFDAADDDDANTFGLDQSKLLLVGKPFRTPGVLEPLLPLRFGPLFNDCGC